MKVLQQQREHVKALRQKLDEMQQRGISGLAKEICSREGARVEDLFANGRSRPQTRARQMMWWELKDRGWTYVEIGNLFQRSWESIRTGIRLASRDLGLVNAGSDRRAA
jgi:chromosomal replication initiation ATPase DnaA